MLVLSWLRPSLAILPDPKKNADVQLSAMPTMKPIHGRF
jgi:hypothetical protein